jgi:hypothetical protein
MDPRASDMAVARIAAARLHMAHADDAMGELYYREIGNSSDGARIAELRQIIAFELRQTFLIAANAGLFKPPQHGAGLAPPPVVAPEPDTVIPFPSKGDNFRSLGALDGSGGAA